RPYEWRADGHGSGCTPSGIWCGCPANDPADWRARRLRLQSAPALNVAPTAVDQASQVPKGKGQPDRRRGVRKQKEYARAGRPKPSSLEGIAAAIAPRFTTGLEFMLEALHVRSE